MKNEQEAEPKLVIVAVDAGGKRVQRIAELRGEIDGPPRVAKVRVWDGFAKDWASRGTTQIPYERIIGDAGESDPRAMQVQSRRKADAAFVAQKAEEKAAAKRSGK